MTGICCATDQRRRQLAREAGLNGIDSITVSEDQRRISVSLLGKAPRALSAANVRIDAEVGGRAVRVLAVEPCRDPDPDDADCLLVTVDAPGDRSCYHLSIVETDARGEPGTSVYDGFDPRLSSLAFTFKEHCPQSLDCGCGCGDDQGPAAVGGPVIDYLSRDYASLRQQLLDRLTLTRPGWTERHEADVGITLVELLAYAGDLLHYRLDAVATEAYLDTARLRTSVRRHARLVDYRMHDGAASRAFVCLDADDDVTLPHGSFRFRAGSEVFEPLVDEDVEVVSAHRRVRIWTGGDTECTLPRGTTEAVLAAGRRVRLVAGDLLLLEEVLGAETGREADADPSHRQVVRLTEVVPDRDDPLDQDLLRVRWASDDALDFDLCVRSRGGEDCLNLEVGVARGNIVVVGHGSTVTWCGGKPEHVAWSAPGEHRRGCADRTCFGCVVSGPVDLAAYPPRRPVRRVALTARPVTQEAPWPSPRAVARAQSDAVDRIAPQARTRLLALAGQVPLEDDDIGWLRTVFGQPALDRYDDPNDPARLVPRLASAFDRLLAGKLDRLDRLARRARSGSLLRQDVEGRELLWSWGLADVIDPARPWTRGAARSVCDLDPRAALPVVEVIDADDARWCPAPDLLSAGPADRVFVGESDDDGRLWLRFGDDRQGLAPRAGSTLVASYRVGNGTRGNVGAGSIDTVEWCGVDAGEVRVRNPLPACGGVEPETADEVRRRAPRQAYGVLARAITADDYARSAEAVPGVQRAAALLRWTGAWYEAQVALDAVGTGEPGPGQVAMARERLQRVRRIGHDVVVRPATPMSVRLALCVRVEPDYVTGHVRAAVLDLLGARERPGGLALFAPDRLTFGTPVRMSAVVAAVSAVPGVAGVVVTGLDRQFAPDGGRALESGVLAIDALEVARLDNDVTRPDHGLVALVIGGGR